MEAVNTLEDLFHYQNDITDYRAEELEQLGVAYSILNGLVSSSKRDKIYKDIRKEFCQQVCYNCYYPAINNAS